MQIYNWKTLDIMYLYTHNQNNISNDATIKNGGATGENRGL